MEKISIGVDIENISKFQNLEQSKDRKFLKKIFTDFEIDYCFQKINPAQRDNLRTSLRKELGINLSTHVYVYNGSAQSWQCPQKTVLHRIR